MLKQNILGSLWVVMSHRYKLKDYQSLFALWLECICKFFCEQLIQKHTHYSDFAKLSK